MQDEFEDTKGVVRIHKSKKDLCYRDVSVYNYNSNGCVLHMFDANLSKFLEHPISPRFSVGFVVLDV
jgi:hypothetical protein